MNETSDVLYLQEKIIVEERRNAYCNLLPYKYI